MKYTLLDMVQTILSSMDSDEVNSITDTPESYQVATVVRTAYFDIVSRVNLPEQNSLVTLDASGDNTKPTLMYLPSSVDHIEWLKYNKETTSDPNINMQYVDYLPLNEFLERMYMLTETDTEVGTFTHTVDSDTFTFLYKNNKAPDFYTTFNDRIFIFDSFDAGVDTTLQKNKTLAYGLKIFPFSMTDGFIPPLDDDQFPLLLNEAKSLAWAELKQTPNQKAEQSARRGWVSVQKNKFANTDFKDFDNLPNFGRR